VQQIHRTRDFQLECPSPNVNRTLAVDNRWQGSSACCSAVAKGRSVRPAVGKSFTVIISATLHRDVKRKLITLTDNDSRNQEHMTKNENWRGAFTLEEQEITMCRGEGWRSTTAEILTKTTSVRLVHTFFLPLEIRLVEFQELERSLLRS